MFIPTCVAMHAMYFPKSKGEALHRNRKALQNAIPKKNNKG